MTSIDIRNNEKLSPLMKQYFDIKEQNVDAILFFRVGDFYETFFEDAKTVSRTLNLVLTGKECGLEERAPMCGVPYHAVDTYLSRLIKHGYKVAIAEQVEDPKTAKGLVKREVKRIVTPGTVLASEYLEEKSNNYILSIYYDGIKFGISLVDFSTGEFYISSVDSSKKLYDIIDKYRPTEILYNNFLNFSSFNIEEIKNKYYVSISVLDDSMYDKKRLKESDYLNSLIKKVTNEIIKEDSVLLSIISVYLYIRDYQQKDLTHIEHIDMIEDRSYMYLDSATIKNLELIENIQDRDSKGTIFYILDETKTAMGGRMLKHIIESPLIVKEDIVFRQNVIKALYSSYRNLSELFEYLSAIYDLERINARINMKNANAKDLIALKNSLQSVPYIKIVLKNFDNEYTNKLANELDTLKDVYDLIDKAIVDDPPYLMHDGNIIKDGFDKEIDRLRNAKVDGETWIAELEKKEKEKTGIKNLKIKYSRLTGYLFEVTNAYKGEVPDYFIRKQTLANAERYATDELNKLADTILSAGDRLKVLEYEIFQNVRDKVMLATNRINKLSHNISMIDAFSSLTKVAYDNHYVCPTFNDEGRIYIKDGRHPVIEKINVNESFVSNDTLITKDKFIHIITGPNMAGKSTYMRQIAIIVLMAHIGSFVPATSCDLCIVDRIFTRVGASDDLSRGRSTFMVEMTEVASIVNEATDKSLIILDEIGRGTSTFDGMSIAWSVVEYINDKIKAKTLFATHYHELTELENKISGVENYNVVVEENDGDVKFIRKIEKGNAKKSYGIAVAKLAGLPNEIIKRANEILALLENKE